MRAHDQAGDDVNEMVRALPTSSSQPNGKNDAANPASGDDQCEGDDKSGLAERADRREEKGARGGVHERKLVKTIRVDFAGVEDGSTGLEPNPVILRAVSADRMPHRDEHKNQEDEGEKRDERSPAG